MKHNSDKSPAEDLEGYPELRVVELADSDKKTDSASRPELAILGWEPRKQRLACLRSAGYKFKS